MFKVKKEGLICCANLCGMASQDQMKILVKNGCIDVICSFLSEEDITTLDNIVSALESILFHGRQIQQEFTYAENPYGHYLEEKRYLERLDSIISKNNFAPNNIVMKIENIINLYIKDETEKI